jgi:hypothetical protein
MGDRQRYQSQYDRGRRLYSDDYRERDRDREQRIQPREWQPSEDYRRESYRGEELRNPRERYANYYNDRQFGTRGRDEREQGNRYGTEEEWRPWPSDSGYASREAGAGRDYGSSRSYGSNRDYASSRDSGWNRDSAWNRDYGSGRDEPQHRPQYSDYERSYGWGHPQRSSEDREYRGSGERQRDWGSQRYRADNDYSRDDEQESFGHQLREAGQKIARSVKRAFRGPKGYKRSDDRIREDVSDRLGENPWLNCSEVEVTVSNGEVTLTGSVNSRQEKFLIEEIADDVNGVSEVHNQVRVKREQQQQNSLAMAETAPGTQTSAEVAARVRNARA